MSLASVLESRMISRNIGVSILAIKGWESKDSVYLFSTRDWVYFSSWGILQTRYGDLDVGWTTRMTKDLCGK